MIKMKAAISSEPVIFIYAFNFATWVAIIPQVILYKVCLKNVSLESSICKNISKYPDYQLETQKESTYWQMTFFLTLNILSFFSILILGPATDVVGRKKGFLFVAFIMACMNGVLLVNIYHEEASPGYLIFSAILSGLFGDLSGVILLCYSDMADVTENTLKTRTLKMGILESCLFLGLGTGGFTSGYLIEHFGFESVPIANMVLAGVLFGYIVLVLPKHRDATNVADVGEESLQLIDKSEDKEDKEDNLEFENKVNADENDTPKKVDISLFNPWFHLKHVLRVFYETPAPKVTLIVLFFGYFLAMFTITGDGYVLALYLKNAPFNVSPSTLGILISIHGFVGFFGAILGGCISYHCSIPDYLLLIVGLIGQLCTFVMLGLARSLTLVLVSRITGMTHPIVSSTFRSYVTKVCGICNKHGSVLSALECLDVVAGILSSFIVLIIYRATLSTYSGIIFFVLAGFSAIATSLIAFVSLKRRMTKKL